MFTEVDLSEYSIRARLKLGDIAEKISNEIRHGSYPEEMIDTGATIRQFLNALNSSFKDWSLADTYKRVDHIADKYELLDRPKHTKDWLNRFIPPIIEIQNQAGGLNLPQNDGHLYVISGVLTAVPDNRNTINDLSI
jgi:hypothetical protein